jgi:recombination protein RecT
MTDVETAPLRAELEVQVAPKELQNIFALVKQNRPALARLLGSDAAADKFETELITQVRSSPGLLECHPASIIGGYRLAAQLGLSFGPQGLAYLVPFGSKEGKWAQFVIGYRGFVELAFRSGQVKDVTAALVHDGDEFDYQYGTQPRLVHKPLGPAGEREITAAYAVARLKTGGAPFRVIYEEDWEKARLASQLGARNRGPWNEHRPAMILKTAVRRLEPMLPKTAVLAQAVEADEQPAPDVDDLEGTEL